MRRHGVELLFEAIPAWTDPETPKRMSAGVFQADYDDTLRKLAFEVSKLDADQVIVQLVMDAADLRQDGALRARAQVRHPGVVVSIDTPEYGALRYASDAYESRYYEDVDWQANLRAIALSLEALRSLRRWGMNTRGEAYRGWRAIEGGIPLPAAAHPMTRQQAAEFIVTYSGQHAIGVDEEGVLRYEAVRKSAIRAAQRALHPDNGGSTEMFQHLNNAIRTLEETE